MQDDNKTTQQDSQSGNYSGNNQGNQQGQSSSSNQSNEAIRTDRGANANNFADNKSLRPDYPLKETK